MVRATRRFAVGKCVKVLVLGTWASNDNADELHQAEQDALELHRLLCTGSIYD